MKRLTPAALLVAGALLLSACSSNSDTAGSSSASARSSETSVAASSTEPSGSASSGPETAATTAASSAAAAPIDAQTTAWFDTLCTGIAPIKSVESAGPETPNPDPAAGQQALISAIQTLSGAFTSTSATLATTPPPTFEGGAEFASTVTTGLGATGADLAKSAETFAAVDPSDASKLAAAKTTLQADLIKAVGPLQSISGLDPAIQAATTEIPSCKSLGV